jgi:hypothetical protein
MFPSRFLESLVLLSTFIIFLVFNVSAQEESPNRIGISLAGEFLPEQSFNPNFGFFGLRNFTQKSGIEVGVLYRTELDGFTFDFEEPDGNTYFEYVSMRKGFLNFPVLYRFTTKFVTFSAGPNIDAFATWNQLGGNRVTVNSFSISPSVTVGPLVKISRVIPIKGSLALEPEFRIGQRSFSEADDLYVGFGIRIQQSFSF